MDKNPRSGKVQTELQNLLSHESNISVMPMGFDFHCGDKKYLSPNTFGISVGTDVTYEWYKDATLIGTTQILEVTTSGDYSLIIRLPDGSSIISEVVTLNFLGPCKPIITTPTNSDTTNATPTICGTADPGTTINVYEGSTLLCTVTTGTGGSWCCVSTPLSDGTHTITATAIGSGTIGSPPSDPVTFTVDATAPFIPVITSPTDGSTISTSTPTITGTAEPGSTVRVYEGTKLVCTATTGTGGAWSCVAIVPFSNGSHTITATATDPAGNTSVPSSPVTFTVDTIPPSAPVITSPADGSTISISTPTITGTAEPGSTVRVYEGTKLVCTATTGTGGAWSCVAIVPFSNGFHTITATATDPAGNTSVPSSPVIFAIVLCGTDDLQYQLDKCKKELSLCCGTACGTNTCQDLLKQIEILKDQLAKCCGTACGTNTCQDLLKQIEILKDQLAKCCGTACGTNTCQDLLKQIEILKDQLAKCSGTACGTNTCQDLLIEIDRLKKCCGTACGTNTCQDLLKQIEILKDQLAKCCGTACGTNTCQDLLIEIERLKKCCGTSSCGTYNCQDLLAEIERLKKCCSTSSCGTYNCQDLLAEIDRLKEELAQCCGSSLPIQTRCPCTVTIGGSNYCVLYPQVPVFSSSAWSLVPCSHYHGNVYPLSCTPIVQTSTTWLCTPGNSVWKIHTPTNTVIEILDIDASSIQINNGILIVADALGEQLHTFKVYDGQRGSCYLTTVDTCGPIANVSIDQYGAITVTTTGGSKIYLDNYGRLIPCRRKTRCRDPLLPKNI